MGGLKISALLILMTVILSMKLFGQQQAGNSNKSKAYYSVFAGAGRSIFHSSIEGPSKFPTPEFRLGAGVGIPLTTHFELISRLDFGIKVKRKPIDPPGGPYRTISSLYFDQDEMTTWNHYFFEIPVMIQYRFTKPKLNLGVGLNYRSFFYVDPPQGSSRFDPLSGKKEFGATGRISYRFGSKITVGLEQYLAINKLYNSGGIYNGEEYKMTVKNRFTQFTIEYRLSK